MRASMNANRLRLQRGVAGPYMTLYSLAKVLPSDYLVRITDKYGTELWKGIAWVMLYDPVKFNFGGMAVMKFETDYYNEEATIQIANVVNN